MDLNRIAAFAAEGAEALGIGVMIAGAVVALPLVFLRAGRKPGAWYRLYRRYLGSAILLGLEFLVAADIIRTVSHDPTLQNVVVLAIVVMIRTLLSFTLSVELEGRWPWQRGRPSRGKRRAVE